MNPETDDFVHESEATTDRTASAPHQHRLREASGYNGLTLYLTEIGRMRSLSRQQERALAERASQGDDEARGALIEAHLRLVVRVARAYAHCGVPLLDLVAEGNLGLMRAAERYDCRQQARFSTYAIWWVRNGILRALASQNRVIRLPLHVIEALQRFNRVHQKLAIEHGREPLLEEIAHGLQLPLAHVEMLRQLMRRPVSLEADPTNEQRESPLDRIVDERAESPSEIAAQYFLRARLEEILDTLSLREREIIELRYGLRDGTLWTRAAIGRHFGVTREAIRQLENKALRKIRHPARLRLLRAASDASEFA
jgi:RNA polymerase primary sigma factor